MPKCSICKLEGHNKSNKKFHSKFNNEENIEINTSKNILSINFWEIYF